MTTNETAVMLPEQVFRTPEGIEVRFTTATASERLVALAIDVVMLLLALLVLGLFCYWTLGVGALLLVAFVVRHGYFVWFETRWMGRTPGKRLFDLRVVRADGGPLSVETLLARNLTREVEFFLPLTLLARPDMLFADHEGVVRLVASLWILLLLFFPLTNPHRLRVGDLLAGTRVVTQPRVTLAQDLADQGRAAARDHAVAPAFTFTAEQLSIYGEHELGVLEDLLRKAKARGDDPALAAVVRSICGRIRWRDTATLDGRHREFLTAFYRAQRDHLERGLLLGRRRLRKTPRKPEP